MLQIDGDKIKRLREQQGLTQLYLATAVAVTTDTISRWENRRYPSIKRENGEKLAEALGVRLEDILLPPSHSTETLDPAESEPGQENEYRPTQKSQKRISVPVFVISAVFIIICAFIFFHHSSSVQVKATRKLPTTALPGKPFPVVIEVTGPVDSEVSIILKEHLPPHCMIVATAPATSDNGREQGTVKWLKKIRGKATFSYMVTLTEPLGSTIAIKGTVSMSEQTKLLQISGENSVQIGPYHWADSDRDYRISDQEILAVFDYYSSIDNFTIDIPFIEKLWLASSYTWDKQTGEITIHP